MSEEKEVIPRVTLDIRKGVLGQGTRIILPDKTVEPEESKERSDGKERA